MIEFENVTRRFGNVVGVTNLDFAIERGDVVGLLGANGAGKTTTMRLMTGYFPPSDGEVRIAGQSIQKNPLAAKRRIGYLPEQLPLYDEMVARDYLKYIAALRDIPPEQLEEKIERVLDRLEIHDQADRLLGNLSRGYRQRMSLAQAMIHEPDILVLDEPTLGLDPKQVRRLRELIKELARDSTLVISSHILHEVRQICKRVVILHEGEMVAVDTPEKLATQMQRGQSWELHVARPTSDWEGDLASLSGLEQVETVGEGEFQLVFETPDPANREGLFELCVRHDVPILSLSRSELELEEIFLDITERQYESDVEAEDEDVPEEVSEGEPA